MTFALLSLRLLTGCTAPASTETADPTPTATYLEYKLEVTVEEGVVTEMKSHPFLDRYIGKFFGMQ